MGKDLSGVVKTMDDVYKYLVDKEGYNPCNDFFDIEQEHFVDIYNIEEKWREETFRSDMSCEELQSTFGVLFDFFDSGVIEEIGKIVQKYNIPVDVVKKSLELDSGCFSCIYDSNEIEEFIKKYYR